MKLARRLASALLLVLGLAATVRAAPPTVLLISLDGTPPEAVQTAGLETLQRLGERGATARLLPVFPTNTFPNHVTLVTGVAPDRHGIVNNVFVDPDRGPYRYESDPTWVEVEPLWSLLARHGRPSAAFHWVGSEGPWRSGLGPRHWRAFDRTVPETEKIEQILAWLDLPEPAERPRLVTSWFRGADRVAHHFGPASERVGTWLRGQDRALGQLVAGLEQRALWPSTTLLVVSDHGMAPVERSVDLAAAYRNAGLQARVLGGGGFAIVEAGSEPEGVERTVAVARSLGLSAYSRGSAPAELRVSHARFGDAVVLAPPGTAIGRTSGAGEPPAPAEELALRGAHGYPPEADGMQALFVAFGRGVPAGTRLGTIPALAVAPTVLALLGVPVPDWMESPPVARLLTGLESATSAALPSQEHQ